MRGMRMSDGDHVGELEVDVVVSCVHFCLFIVLSWWVGMDRVALVLGQERSIVERKILSSYLTDV